MLTQARLKEKLDYDQLTGIFIWKDFKKNSYVGKVAGSLNSRKYILIEVDQKKYCAHRLAWLYVYGEMPIFDIDHVDTIRHHNWIDNLRLATDSENQQNIIKARKDNRSGLLGAFLLPSGNFKSEIRINNKVIQLGTYALAIDAHNAYISAKRKYHPFNTL